MANFIKIIENYQKTPYGFLMKKQGENKRKIFEKIKERSIEIKGIGLCKQVDNKNELDAPNLKKRCKIELCDLF